MTFSLPGLLVIILLQTEGPDVAVDDGDIPVRIGFLQLQGVLDGLGTAVAAAVGPFFVPGSDALDHDDAFCPHGLRVLLGDELLQLPLRHDLVGLRRRGTLPFQFVAAGGDDDDAVLERSPRPPSLSPSSCSCR